MSKLFVVILRIENNMPQVIASLNNVVQNAITVFKNEFKEDPNIAVFAPGRVNLIGEHTDYNDGFVMPMALPLVTVIVGKQISGTTSTVLTTCKDADPPKQVTIEMPSKDQKLHPGTPKWANYVKGVIANFFVTTIPAFNAVIDSTVPLGGGLSSSAALEVATYTFLEALTGKKQTISQTDKALACQKAEHQFANVPCGIMDQFIAIMGKAGNALLIDCKHLTSTLIPLADPDIVILITNSNVKHELTGSEYSSRRKHCQEAAEALDKSSLREATVEDIDALKTLRVPEEIVKRARHVITEIKRTVEGAEALKKKEFKKFGDLMIQSHISLRDDFEVSCKELDQLVELALQTEGVLGSRMTGGGFGGCTVTMATAGAVDKTIAHIRQNYKGKPTFYVCKPCDGCKIL